MKTNLKSADNPGLPSSEAIREWFRQSLTADPEVCVSLKELYLQHYNEWVNQSLVLISLKIFKFF